jgi:hypothetical protein
MEHRFILLGRKTFFAYHLGLFFVPPHAFQMILKVDLGAPAADAYLTDLATGVPEGKKRFYSLKTQPPFFPLSDIHNGTRHSFDAVVERVLMDTATAGRTFTPLKGADGNDVITTVTIRTGGERYFSPIGVTDYPEHCTGLLFGTPEETYLAHRLAKADHWDEVLAVDHVTPPVSADGLDSVPVVTVPALPDTLSGDLTQQHSPFTEGTEYKGQTSLHPGDPAQTLTFTAGAQQWWNSTTLNDRP